MTPAEKAKELFEKYSEYFSFKSKENMIADSKGCALIAVGQLIEFDAPRNKYWKEVKKKIKKL